MIYNIITLFWAAVVGAGCGYVTYKLGDSDPRAALALGTVACIGGAALVVAWREFKRPG